MYEYLIFLRNTVTGFLYRRVFKKFFFAIDPEKVHDGIIVLGRMLGGNSMTRMMTAMAFGYSNKSLEQNILGTHFKNPVGLSAGFDKDAELTDIIPSVGFGFEEIGSVTGEPCEGNPKPRLWRLPRSKALVVYYGLKSRGCEYIAQTLRNKKFYFPIGVNIAKTNSKDTIDCRRGVQDYCKAFCTCIDVGDYFTINISCPNTFGGEPFTDPERLDILLSEIDAIPTAKPIFLKLSPDLDTKDIDAILAVVSRHRIHGFVCTNLTKKRENAKILESCPSLGGISGKVVEGLANRVIEYIYRATKGKYVIIGCGGVFTAEDAYKKIRSGASLIQLITGMVFEGPQVVGDINRGLARLLQKDGFKNINEVVGIDAV